MAAKKFRYLASACRVNRSADKSISTATWTLVDWDSESGTGSFDTDTLHDTSTNNSRLTATMAGKYIVMVSIVWEPTAGGTLRIVQIEKNSDGTHTDANAVAAMRTDVLTSGYVNPVFASCIVSLAAGDRVEAFVYQDSGGNLNFRGSTAPISWFGMAYIGE